MPEGDTVFAAAARLHRALGGREIVTSDLRVPRYASADLSRRRIEEVTSRGKHIFIRAGDLTLHTHFELQGEWHLYRGGDRWRRPRHEARAIIETDVWSAVGFNLPVVEVLARSRDEEAVAHLGPDLLGDAWDETEALRRLRARPERAVGEALLDQRCLAGIGNVYRAEICFLRGVHPATPISEVEDLEALVRLARRLLWANRHTGTQITTGDTRPGRTRWVYGRRGDPCLRCGSSIAEERDRNARVSYRCPTCQPRPDLGSQSRTASVRRR